MKAKELYEIVAKRGDVDAQALLGKMHASGEGTDQDLEKALFWYEKAAAQGDEGSIRMIKKIKESGLVKKGNENTGRSDLWNKYYSMPTEELLRLGEQALYSRNYTYALGILSVASVKGSSEAAYKLGVMYDKGYGTAQDAQQAMNYFRMASSRGHTGAMNNIGLMYEEGRGVQRSFSQAIEWYTDAANKGLDMAQYNLGVVYLDGKGVPKNIELATKYFRMAADQGMKEAQQMLNRILWGSRNRYK